MAVYDILLLDLDDTLYPASNGLWEEIRIRIIRYMTQNLRIDPAEVHHLRQAYLEEYGTTLNGLIHHYQIDPLEYLDYVHPVDLKPYLDPDPVLKEMLASLPQRKIIFTNSYFAHAERVLARLGVLDTIDGIYGILALGLTNKPQRSAYLKLIELAPVCDPARCLFVDDREANLLPAIELGMTTVLLSPDHCESESHYRIAHIHALDQVVPELRV